MMDQITPKVKQWIDSGKDPRSAHWQGGLESVLDVFMPYLEPGKLTPVQPLEEDELNVFLSALEVVDLSPMLFAAFLPPSIARHLVPPESAEELLRIEPGKPSFKILVAGPGNNRRILCAEVSAHADKPGIDIFQSGALLGSYNFDSRKECFEQFGKILRTHIWGKDKWRPEDYTRYTINWFEKVLDLRSKTVSVHKDFSFFHSPTLVKSNKIDVIFSLIFEVIVKRLNDPEGPYQDAISSIQKVRYKDDRMDQYREFADQTMLFHLAVIREMELVKFDELTDKEARQFKHESERTILRIFNQIVS